MEALALLNRALDAGIEIHADGEQLQVRGPKRHAGMIRELFEHESELLAILRTKDALTAPASQVGPAAEAQWLVERDLDPASIKDALAVYLATEWDGPRSDVSQGKLLSRFNAWLEGQGRKPTTLPVMRSALGVKEPIKPLRAVIAPCPRCGGTDWGDSGRRETDGTEVWQCRTCPCPLSHAGRAEETGFQRSVLELVKGTHNGNH